MYNTEHLQEKWAPILDYDGVDPIKDAHRRATTAILLENQEKELREEASFLSEQPTNSAGTGGFTAGAVYGVAYDASTKRLYFYENNSALNSGNHFATYTGSAPLGPGASMYVSPSSSKLIFNMGNNGFTYTPPTGYVAVNTTNLGS